jgi:hypothetical protein
MRRFSEIVGGILILVGITSIFNMLGIHLWGFFWAFALIALGVWFIRGVAVSKACCDVVDATVALEGAEEADVRLRHGAGRLTVAPGHAPDALLNGSFGGGVEVRKSMSGKRLQADLRLKERDPFRYVFPWISGRGASLDWSVNLNPAIATALHLETGASESALHLTDMMITELTIRTGASSTTVDLPAKALRTRVTVESGAASIKLRVPEGVAAKILIRAGLSGVHVDTSRFPPTGDGYRSPDYDVSVNKVDVFVESGIGSIDIF